VFRAGTENRRRILCTSREILKQVLKAWACAALKVFPLLLLLGSMNASGAAYTRASEGRKVVRGKLMPKARRIELNVDGGLILNQSFVDTYLGHASLNYYFSEVWGIGLEGAVGMNSDKSERECVESFYNNPQQLAGAPCPNEGVVELPTGGNIGPAYVRIRQIDTIILGNAIWSPVYGKQLFFLSGLLHFDLFFNFGGGVVMSTIYPKSTTTRGDGGGAGRPTRTPADPAAVGQTAAELGIGCALEEEFCYGIDGRPDATSETHPVINLGIGQKLLFNKTLGLKLELRDLLIIDSENGFENLFAIWGGLTLRL
jgi:outer membrane beta-barrel protein